MNTKEVETAGMVRMLCPRGVNPGTQIGTSEGVFEVKDRIALVDPRSVSGLESAGWKVLRAEVSEKELDQIRAKRKQISDGRPVLAGKLEEAKTTRMALSHRAAMIGGDETVESAMDLHGKIAAAEFAEDKFRRDLDAADADLVALSRTIAEQESLRDTPRQILESEPLRAEFDEKLAAFVEAAANFTGMLEPCKAIAERIAKEYPLVAGPGTIPLWGSDDSLESRIRAAWRPGASLDNISSRALAKWILDLLAGPDTSVAAGELAMQRSNLRERA